MEALCRWADAAVRHIHLVDLGAAFGGAPVLAATVKQARTRWPSLIIQVAGGIRSAGVAELFAESGADRVILGSLVFSDPEEAGRCVKALGPGRCVAALDVRQGCVRMKGWTEEAGATLEEACDRAASLGFTEVLVTDISRDGLLSGPALDLYGSVGGTGLGLIASGGIASVDDLEALSGLPHVTGAVIGKALYEGRLTSAQVLGCLT
jgi:phosphoribosylformimino-5-aminoimidazole carboxamide ribotide isomerase